MYKCKGDVIWVLTTTFLTSPNLSCDPYCFHKKYVLCNGLLCVTSELKILVKAVTWLCYIYHVAKHANSKSDEIYVVYGRTMHQLTQCSMQRSMWKWSGICSSAISFGSSWTWSCHIQPHYYYTLCNESKSNRTTMYIFFSFFGKKGSSKVISAWCNRHYIINDNAGASFQWSKEYWLVFQTE